ncbi:MAG TPA: hypothetical protein VF054_16155 [Micromonosporaceae bacterium]
MAWFRRRGRKARSTLDRVAYQADFDHLEQFAHTRRGVEAYLEPRTTVTETTVVLIADDGEWTRRRVPNASVARQWAHRMGIPIYEVMLMGYPQRMRDFNARRKRAEQP